MASRPDRVLIRHPVVDVTSGLVTPEWANWFQTLGTEGGNLRNQLLEEIFEALAARGQVPPEPGAPGPPIVTPGLTPWDAVDKTGSDLGDLETRLADVLTGHLPWPQLPLAPGTWNSDVPIDGALRVSKGITVDGGVVPVTPGTGALGLPALKFEQLFAAALHAESLVTKDHLGTIGGRQLVGPATYLTAGVGARDTAITVKHAVLAVEDRLYLATAGQLEWMAVTAGPFGAGPYGYNVSRNIDGSGPVSRAAGDAVFNTGQVGDGCLDLYAHIGLLAGVGPTLVGWRRIGLAWNALVPYCALGNLNGLYGYTTDIYGVAFGDPAGEWITVDPIGGVRFAHPPVSGAAGPPGAVQYNHNGPLGGQAAFRYDPLLQNLIVGENCTITGAGARGCVIFGQNNHITD